MTLGKEYQDYLSKLNHLRGKKGWKTFFKKVDELEKLGESINDQMHFGGGRALSAVAETMAEQLNDNKDEQAQKAGTGTEYDAVLGLASYLDDHFKMKN